MGDEPQPSTFADVAAWRGWLGEHHADSPGVCLVLAKKGATEPTSLTYRQALEVALCYGWIDGQAKGGDDASYRQRFTPRRSRSLWSKRNVALAEQLISEGSMHPAGVAEVERAKADGRWEAAYAGPATMEVPADLTAALDSEPGARLMFDILTSQNRYAILHRLHAIKRGEARALRIDAFVAMLARGETPYPQKRTLTD